MGSLEIAIVVFALFGVLCLAAGLVLAALEWWDPQPKWARTCYPRPNMNNEQEDACAR